MNTNRTAIFIIDVLCALFANKGQGRNKAPACENKKGQKWSENNVKKNVDRKNAAAAAAKCTTTFLALVQQHC